MIISREIIGSRIFETQGAHTINFKDCRGKAYDQSVNHVK